VTQSRVTPATAPTTMPAMAPVERLLEGAWVGAERGRTVVAVFVACSELAETDVHEAIYVGVTAVGSVEDIDAGRGELLGRRLSSSTGYAVADGDLESSEE